MVTKVNLQMLTITLIDLLFLVTQDNQNERKRTLEREDKQTQKTTLCYYIHEQNKLHTKFDCILYEGYEKCW